MSLGRTIFIVFSFIQPAFIEAVFFLCTQLGAEFVKGCVGGKRISEAHCLKRDFTGLRTGEFREAVM